MLNFLKIFYMGTYLKGACAVKASCREAVHSALTILEKAIIGCQSLTSNLQQGIRAVETCCGYTVTVASASLRFVINKKFSYIFFQFIACNPFGCCLIWMIYIL